MVKYFCYCLFLLSLCTACKFGSKKSDPTLRDFTFEPVKGIRYQEVRRRFSTGLSFNAEGFMQKPSWIIEVAAEDTMMAWSPQKKVMQKFYLQYDHGDVYNFAKEWFKVKKITKDSLIFRRVQVNGKVIANDISSDVNMTFYAQSYIANELKTTASQLQKPSRADSLFIKRRCAVVNLNSDSAFSATEPVQFISKSKIGSVIKMNTVNELEGRTAAYDYMFPQYRIVIDRAYKDFVYDFTAVVDYKGNMHVKTISGIMPEEYESKKKVVQAIADIYIRNLFKIAPGTTLGIAHNSGISIGVVGKRIKRP